MRKSVLIENGTIKKQDSHYVLSQKISDLQVPDTVQGIIAARMDRLEENLKRTMQVASVIGRDFAFRILQTITGMREELKSYLLNLQGLELIYEKRLFPELEYIFKHALTQEVAYNSLLLKRRKQIHENIGKAIEEIYSERLEEFYEMLAYHYSKSENRLMAIQYLKLSGKKSVKNYANQEAYNFFLEALRLLNRLQDTKRNKKERIEVSLSIAIPMIFLSYPEGSFEILQKGEKLSIEIGDKKSITSFYGSISTYYTFKGDPLEGIKYAEPRFNQALRNQDIEWMMPLLYGLCFSYEGVGNYIKIIEIATKTIALLEKNNLEFEYFSGSQSLYSYLCNYNGLSLTIIGEIEEGKKFLEKGRRLAIEINDMLSIAQNELGYTYLYLLKRDGNKAIKCSQNLIKYTEEANWIYLNGLAWYYSGRAHLLIGDLDIAEEHVRKGFEIHKSTNSAFFTSNYLLALSEIKREKGDLSKSQYFLEENLKVSLKFSLRSHEGISKVYLGRILEQTDVSKAQKAEKYILEGIEILAELRMKPSVALSYFILGELYANTNRKDEAIVNLNKALSMYREMGIGYWPDKIKEVLDRL